MKLNDKSSEIFTVLVFTCFHLTEAIYEDVRCKCICPNPNIVNGSSSDRKLYIANVPPKLCICDQIVLPELPKDFPPERGGEFCIHCECKYESRNTTTIKVVVILVICIVSVLVAYLIYLEYLEPLLRRRRTAVHYQQHQEQELAVQDEEDDLSGRNLQPAFEHVGVMNRVGTRQNRWKRQVAQQRANIYDRHTMLN